MRTVTVTKNMTLALQETDARPEAGLEAAARGRVDQLWCTLTQGRGGAGGRGMSEWSDKYSGLYLIARVQDCVFFKDLTTILPWLAQCLSEA